MIRLPRLLPLAVLVLAGCGGSSPQTAAPAAPAPVAPVAAPATPVTSDPAVGNFFTDSLPHWRAARAAVHAGTTRAGFAAIGDSTTYGIGGGGDLQHDAVSFSWPTQLAAVLVAAGLPAHAGSFFGDASLNTNLYATDPRLAEIDGGGGTEWHEDTGLPTAGGYAYVNDGGPAPLVFTPVAAIDTADVYDVGASSGSPFTVDAGGSPVAVAPPATPSTTVRRTTLHVVLGHHAVTVTPTGAGPGGVALIGIDTYDSTVRDVAVWNLGWPGSRTTDWTAAGGAQAPLAFVAQLAPALAVIGLGINDMTHATPLDAFRTALQAIVAAAQKGGDVIVVVPNRIDPATVGDAVQDSYAAAIRDVAKQANVPVYDASAALGTFGGAQAAGYMFDGLHPSGAGYGVIAAGLGRMLTAN